MNTRLKECYVKCLKTLEPGLLVQFVKYGISGSITTLVHIIFFYFLAWKIFPSLEATDFIVGIFGLPVSEVDVATRSFNSMLCNAVTFIFSNMVAYLLNLFWVFKPGKHSRVVEIGLFYLATLISMVIGTGTMGALIRYFGIQTTYAFSVNIVFAVMINFGMRKFYIFKR